MNEHDTTSVDTNTRHPVHPSTEAGSTDAGTDGPPTAFGGSHAKRGGRA